MKLDLKNLDFKLPDLPKKVALSLVALVASAVLFGVLTFTLGAATDAAIEDVTKLRNDVAAARQKVKQAKEDVIFVGDNSTRFDTLMGSDKLIPHTRRTAIRQMQSLALEFGLTTLNYNFQSAGGQAAESVATQPKSGDYKVYIENIELTVGSALDRDIYSFIAALNDDFPGSMIISSAELKRASNVTTESLNLVSRGEDSKLVEGKMKFTWRTAQKQETKK